MTSNNATEGAVNNDSFFNSRLDIDKYLERNRMDPIGIAMLLIAFFVLGTSI